MEVEIEAEVQRRTKSVQWLRTTVKILEILRECSISMILIFKLLYVGQNFKLFGNGRTSLKVDQARNQSEGSAGRLSEKINDHHNRNQICLLGSFVTYR